MATGSQGEASNREQASPTPCLRKKGGTAGDGDREGLGWPPRELALLFVLPKHQSTTIPPLLRKKLGAERKKGRKQHERERDIERVYRLTRGRLKQRTSFPTPVPPQKGGGTAGDDDREGLGWPPSELALLFVLPEHQSTTIPPLLRKARTKRKKGRKQHQRNKDPKKR